MSEVRVRFAPSPTGMLHVGGARTALFNWLFARHSGGKFIIRIEDTDAERSNAGFEAGILEDLAWLGLDWDEGPGRDGDHGPYRQTERVGIYRDQARRLVDEGRAFPCFCSDEVLEAKREQARAAGRPPHYDGACRELGEEERKAARDKGLSESIRFRVGEASGRTIQDLARGEVSFPAGMVGDFVIMRSNGLPTYNFAAAVDDGFMGITHVIRGGEHLANTLRQVMIYEALSMRMPAFAHIPLILGEDRTKLSKRHGAPNIADYREKGYPPEAVINYLAFLGWSTKGESEIMSPGDLVAEFELERVSDSPSVFDVAKLDWVSANHVRQGGAERYFEDALPFFAAGMREEYGHDELERIFAIVSENLSSFSLIPREARAFEKGAPEWGGEEMEMLKGSGELLAKAAELFGSLEPWEPDGIRGAVKQAGRDCGVKGKGLYMPVRVALTGMQHGPDLTSIVHIRGREDVAAVLAAAAEAAGPRDGEDDDGR